MTTNTRKRTRKSFPTLAVMGAYTGYLLEEGKFGQIHEVMDHFYPGIMTIGVGAMQPNAAAEIKRQRPEVADVPGDPAKYREFAEASVAALGATMDLEGPIDVSKGEAEEAFRNFGKPAVK